MCVALCVVSNELLGVCWMVSVRVVVVVDEFDDDVRVLTSSA